MAAKKSGNESEERTVHAVVPSQVKKGDVMAFVYWTRVSDVRPGHLYVDDLDGGKNFEVIGDELVVRSFSADQFEEEVKISMTKAAEMLVSAHNRPFTVCFEKKDGDERVLRGRLVRPEPLLGRSMCEDLDTKDKNRLRLVDHRTIKWLVLEGVKYVVKTKEQ